MCYNCWQHEGNPSIVNDKTKKAAELVKKVYESPRCLAGGHLHIVTDDWNLDDDDIDFCIKAIKEDDSQYEEDEDERYTEEELKIMMECAESLKALTHAERYSALAIADGFIKIDND